MREDDTYLRCTKLTTRYNVTCKDYWDILPAVRRFV